MVRREKTQCMSTLGLLVIGIMLLAASLRSPITSVGPLISHIREAFSISNSVAGILTTVPLLAFAIVSPFAPKIAKKLTIEKTLVIALIFLTVGIFIRSLAGITLLFVGTVLIGIGIAAGNVLLPALIKQKFAHKVGLLTGVFAVSMNLSAAIAAGISVPLAQIDSIGWRGSLGIWGILTLAALFVWIRLMNLTKRQGEKVPGTTSKNTNKAMWKSPLAWQVTIFMGTQSLIYYALVAWLPEILQEQGMTMLSAGWMMSVLQFALFPITFIVPILAGRVTNQSTLVWLTFFTFGTGVVGLFFPTDWYTVLFMILLGIGSGFAFSLSMMFFSLRTKTAEEASELSGMAQSVGYLLAAIAPTLFGLLRDGTGSWIVPLVCLVGAVLVILFVGLQAAKDQYVHAEK